MQSLDKLRIAKGYTQENIAKLLNIATPTYCQYEKGQRLVPKPIADAISEILGFSRDDIFLPVKFAIRETTDTTNEPEKEAG